jgi:peroxiredoxin Q/BCP
LPGADAKSDPEPTGKTGDVNVATLKPKDKAPLFALRDSTGKTVKLSDFKGRRLLVYFYPKADTPGCTQQACSVRDASGSLTAHQVEVLGISPDEPEKLSKFDQKYGLRFPLLSDPDSTVAKSYGAWGEKSMYGKKYEGVLRSSFLVDERGTILEAWYKVSPKDTVPNALKRLEAASTQAG